MKLPFVIDNLNHKLADVLNDVLAFDKTHALDIATAYFTVSGYALLQTGLADLASFRLLLGHQPESGERLGLRPSARLLRENMRYDLNQTPFTPETQRLVEELIRFLHQNHVEVRLYERGFLHAKAYLFFADRGPGDRFRPLASIVGSSNFTRPGLTTNRELNMSHKVILDAGEAEDVEASEAIKPLFDPDPADPFGLRKQKPDPQTQREVKSEVGGRATLDLAAWYDARWREARDFKDDLIQLLHESKFGGHEYTPYQIYLKALFTYFQDDLLEDAPSLEIRSAVELTEFQADAVQKARRILARYSGVMVADSVGLGKTWIGKKLLEDYAYHQRQKALVICPASLREMWETALREATIAGKVLSQEILGRQEFEPRPYLDVDLILIDESHNFRNKSAQRYQALQRIIAANGGRGGRAAQKNHPADRHAHQQQHLRPVQSDYAFRPG